MKQSISLRGRLLFGSVLWTIGLGMLALAKLQICFQADPKSLETLGLLARAFVIIGQPVTIRVDPNDPEYWTARTEPTSLPRELVGGLIPLPLVLILLAVALWQWRRMLAMWRDGRVVDRVGERAGPSLPW